MRVKQNSQLRKRLGSGRWAFSERRQTPPRGPRRHVVVSAGPRKPTRISRGLKVGAAENGPLHPRSGGVVPPRLCTPAQQQCHRQPHPGVSTSGRRWLVLQSHSAHSTSTPAESFIHARLCLPLPLRSLHTCPHLSIHPRPTCPGRRAFRCLDRI